MSDLSVTPGDLLPTVATLPSTRLCVAAAAARGIAMQMPPDELQCHVFALGARLAVLALALEKAEAHGRFMVGAIAQQQTELITARNSIRALEGNAEEQAQIDRACEAATDRTVVCVDFGGLPQ